MTRVAIVTGSNKGIGYATVKGLADKFNGDVYLTARNPELGMAAVAELLAIAFLIFSAFGDRWLSLAFARNLSRPPR